MSGVGSIGGADKQYANLPAKVTAKKEEAVSTEPQDKVEIKKDISTARKVIEKVIGSPMGVISGAGQAVGGLLGGGAAGVTGKARRAEEGHAIGTGLANIAMGAAAGAAIATPIIGGIAGGVVGLVYTIISGTSGSLEKVSEKVGAAAEKMVADNQPSESKVKDVVRNFTEGGLTGMGVGAAEGFKEGTRYGAGIVSGVIEGTKGVVTSLIGKYEKPAEAAPETGEKPGFGKKVLNAILSAPRVILGTAVGAAGSVIGMGMEAIDGAIQGIPLGVDNSESASKSVHNVILRLETAAMGTVAGFMTGGPVGAAIGLGSGLVLGHILRRVEKKSGADKEIVDNLTAGVRYAQKDNVYENQPDEYGDVKKTSYESFRDGVEGVMTGTATGIREGAKSGFQAGKGAVDGVFDGVTGLIGGIIGGVTGK